jgi:diguanylate cyclase (GGDEF)-like protein
VVATVESTVLVGYVIVVLAGGGLGYLVSNALTCVIMIAATAVSTTLQFRVSMSTRGRYSLGASAGFLGIALLPGAQWELVLCWAIGLGLGWSVIARNALVGVRIAGRAVVLGSVYLLVWAALDRASAPVALVAAVATLAYLGVALVLMSLPELVDGVSVVRLVRALMPWRLLLVFALNTALVIVVAWLRAKVLLAGVESQTAISIILPLAVTAAVVSEVGMLRTARIARSRLDGVFEAALALPWPPDADPLELMRRYASRALRSDRVEVRDSPPDNRHEIGAPFTTPDGVTRHLVARRSPSRSPYIDRDAQTLLAIAHIGQDAMRERNVTLGLISDAHTDPLTGLPNYRAFQAALVSASRTGPIAVAYIDLDSFKAVNDGHGHEVGNQVLQVLAGRLARAVRPTDLVARVGGDEFVVILTEVTDLEHAEQIVARIIRRVSPPIDLGGLVVAVTLSSGISFSSEDRFDPARLVEEADARMYSSRGRSGMPVRGDDHAPAPVSIGDAVDTVRAVAEILDNKLLSVHYQPLVDNVLGVAIGLEALVRGSHPELGTITPGLLVHEARRTGRLDLLTGQILDRVAEDIPRLQQIVPELRDVHINVEVDQLTSARILPRLEALRTEHPELRLTLEMTENSLNQATESLLAELRELRNSGLRFALDDFGQAYSTMLAIVQYPFDTLKVDRVLVGEAPGSDKSRQVMRSLVVLSRKLGVTMIVEGVETLEERDRLARLGVRYMQGYLFGRPEPIEVLVERMTTHGLTVENATRPEL